LRALETLNPAGFPFHLHLNILCAHHAGETFCSAAQDAGATLKIPLHSTTTKRHPNHSIFMPAFSAASKK
jgi:hypothetical protein